MNKTLKLVAAGTMALAGLGVGAGQASASVGTYNCTLTALRPQISGQYVRAQGTVYCGVTRFVSALPILMEDDVTSNDTINYPSWTGVVRIDGGTRTTFYGPWVACPNTEIGAEELYSKVRMVVSGYSTGFDSSLVQPFSC